MKLFYLAQVQKLLEDYDFQDKYKVMLELEEKLSKLEVDGKIDQDILFEQFGTPAEFASGIVDQYDLSVASTVTDIKQPSIDPTPVINQQQNDYQPQQQNYQNNSYNNNNNNNNNSNYSTNHNSDYNTDQSQAELSAKDSQARKAAKVPVKILFIIISIIFYLLALFVIGGAFIASLALLVYIDFQTAISLLLGVIFLLLTIILSINFIKNIIYSIIEHKMKTIKLILMFNFIILFAFLSKIMLSSTLETVEMHISNNLYTVQNMFYYNNIDVSNIDWLNMDMGEYAKLFGDTIKSVL